MTLDNFDRGLRLKFWYAAGDFKVDLNQVSMVQQLVPSVGANVCTSFIVFCRDHHISQ